LWRLWCELSDERPTLLAGHSLGEFVAFVCAGSLNFETAVQLVADRGRFMQEAVSADEGAMAAIVGLSDEQVCTLCDDIEDVVSPANFNSKGQVVIAGKRAAVLRAIEMSKAAGAKLAKLIPVSVPSHCALMQPAAEKLAVSLSAIDIIKPAIPVIQNVNATIHQDPDMIRRFLIDQLTRPVRWVGTIELMQTLGITKIVECGPGKVLEGLIKRITKEIVLSKGAIDE
jgi:[acyl-carrier-protein] S-malonyltransferase